MHEVVYSKGIMSPKRKITVILPDTLYKRIWGMVLERAKERGR